MSAIEVEECTHDDIVAYRHQHMWFRPGVDAAATHAYDPIRHCAYRLERGRDASRPHAHVAPADRAQSSACGGEPHKITRV